MRICPKPFFLLLGVALVVAAPVRAQQPVIEPEEDTGMRKREPSVFHRPSRDSPVVQLALADALLASGDTKRALKEYRALVHRWHDTPQAVRAQLTYAQALQSMREYDKAFDEFQYLIEYFAGSFPHDTALEAQFAVANHVRAARTGGLLFFRGFRSPERAIPMFEKIIRNAPNWKRAPEAQLYLGLIHEEAKDFELAVDAFETLTQRYPQSEYAAEAQFRSARGLYRIAKSRPRDERASREALSSLAAFVADHRGNPNEQEAQKCREEIKESLADLYYERAVFYDRMRNRQRAAIIAYTDFLKHFPLSTRAADAKERIAALQNDLGEEE